MPSLAPEASQIRRGTRRKSAMEGPIVSAIHPVDERERIFSRNERCFGITSSLRDMRTVATVASSRQPNPKRAEKNVSYKEG